MTSKQFFNQPLIGFDSSKRKWTYILSTILFATIFLLVYQPFGISDINGNGRNGTLHLFGFVLVEIISIFIGLYVCQFVLHKEKITTPIRLKTLVKFFFVELFIINLIHNLIDFYVLNDLIPEIPLESDEDEWIMEDGFFDEVVLGCIFVIPQFFVLSFPFIGNLLFVQISNLIDGIQTLENKLNDYIDKYESEQETDVLIDLKDENDQIESQINLNNILALESNNQYVLIYSIEADEIKKVLIRTRLKKLLGELEGTPILQCHRSYAVNLLNVAHLENQNRKSFLVLNTPNEMEIPVSKSYFQSIRETIN